MLNSQPEIAAVSHVYYPVHNTQHTQFKDELGFREHFWKLAFKQTWNRAELIISDWSDYLSIRIHNTRLSQDIINL